MFIFYFLYLTFDCYSILRKHSSSCVGVGERGIGGGRSKSGEVKRRRFEIGIL